MEFAVNCSSISINQFEGVWSISIHVAIAIGNATITEQERHLQRRIKQLLMGSASQVQSLHSRLSLLC